MREMSATEIQEVSGGIRAIILGAAGSALLDAVKTGYGAVRDHYDQSTVAFRDDPSGRGRALL